MEYVGVAAEKLLSEIDGSSSSSNKDDTKIKQTK